MKKLGKLIIIFVLSSLILEQKLMAGAAQDYGFLLKLSIDDALIVNGLPTAIVRVRFDYTQDIDGYFKYWEQAGVTSLNLNFTIENAKFVSNSISLPDIDKTNSYKVKADNQSTISSNSLSLILLAAENAAETLFGAKISNTEAYLASGILFEVQIEDFSSANPVVLTCTGGTYESGYNGMGPDTPTKLDEVSFPGNWPSNSLTVINKFTAVADVGTILEDAAVTEFDVLANDEFGANFKGSKRIKENSVSIDLANSKNGKNQAEDSADKIGIVVVDTDKIKFTPAKDWNGTAVIKYTAEYDEGSTGNWLDATETTLNITVTAVNDAPEFTDPQPTISTKLILNAIDSTDIVIDSVNNKDVDGDAVITTYSWAILLDGTTWTPIADKTLATLAAADRQAAAGASQGYKIKGTVTITDGKSSVNKEFIVQVGQFVANDDAATIFENATTTDTVTLIDVLNNDKDVDETTPARAKQIKAESLVVVPESAGVATIEANKIRFIPVTNWNGSVTVKYTAQAGDGFALESVATLTITVTPVNSEPVINEDAITIAETPINTFVITTDAGAYSDIETAANGLVIAYTWELVTHNGDAPGTKAIGGNASTVTITAENLAKATVYKITCNISVTDTGDGTAIAKTVKTSRAIFVGKFIAQADDNATVTDELPAVIENTGTAIEYAFDVLANDIDYNVDGTVMQTPRIRSITAATIKTENSAFGAVKVENNKVVFTPALNQNGTIIIDYTASSKINENEIIESSSTLTIKINAVNTAPVLADNKVTLTNNTGDLTVTFETDAYSDVETAKETLKPEYQWQILKYGLNEAKNIDGKTAATITAAEIAVAAIAATADIYTISCVVIIKDDGKNENGDISTEGILSSNSVSKSEKFGNLPPTITDVNVPGLDGKITEGETFNFEVTAQDGDFPSYDGIANVEWSTSNDDGVNWISAKTENMFFNPALELAKEGDEVICKFNFITDNNTQLHNGTRKFKVKVKISDKAKPTAKISEKIYDIIVEDKNEEINLIDAEFLAVSKKTAVRADTVANIDVNDTLVATIDLSKATDLDIEDYDVANNKNNLKYEVQWFIDGATAPVTTTPVIANATTVELSNDFTANPKKIFFTKGQIITAKAVVRDTAETPSEKSSSITSAITVINSAPVIDEAYTPPPFENPTDMDGATFPVQWTEEDLIGGITDNDGDKVEIKDVVIKGVEPIDPSETPYPGNPESLVDMITPNDDGQGNIGFDFNPGNNFDYLKDGEQAKVIITVTVGDGQEPEKLVNKDYDFIITGKNDAPVIDESKVTVNTDSIDSSNKTDSITVTIAPDAIVDAEGETITPTYKWEISTDGGKTWIEITDNTDAELNQAERDVAAGENKVYDVRVTVTATDKDGASDSVSKVINVKVLELYFDTTAIDLGQAILNQQLSGYVLIKNEKESDETVYVKYAVENPNFTKDVKDTDAKIVPAKGVIAIKVSFKATAATKETSILQIMQKNDGTEDVTIDNCVIKAESIQLNDMQNPEEIELVRVAVNPSTIAKKSTDIIDGKITYDVKIEISAGAGAPVPAVITLPKDSIINGTLPTGFTALANVITADNTMVTETNAKIFTFNVTTPVEVNKIYNIVLSDVNAYSNMILSHGTLAVSDNVILFGESDVNVNGSLDGVTGRDFLMLYRYVQLNKVTGYSMFPGTPGTQDDGYSSTAGTPLDKWNAAGIKAKGKINELLEKIANDTSVADLLNVNGSKDGVTGRDFLMLYRYVQLNKVTGYSMFPGTPGTQDDGYSSTAGTPLDKWNAAGVRAKIKINVLLELLK